MKKSIIGIAIILVTIITVYFTTDLFKPPIEVYYYKAQREDLPIIISASGYISFNNKVDIYPKFSSTLLDIRVKQGQRVKKGDILATLDTKEIESQIKNLELMLEFVKTQEVLSSRGNILGNFLGMQTNNSSNNSMSFESIRGLLEIYYNNLKEMLQEKYLKSPIDGIVVSVNAEKGQKVSPNTSSSSTNLLNLGSLSNFSSLLGMIGGSTTNSIMTIVDISSINAVVRVDETNVMKIKEGQKADVKVDALGDKWWEGYVKSVSFSPSIGKDGTYAYEVRIGVPTLGDKVKEGMSVSCNIYVGVKKNALVIPLSAIEFKEGKTYAYIINDNHAIEKEVTLGDILGDKIEVLKGIKEGDFIILSPPKNLKNKSKVRGITYENN